MNDRCRDMTGSELDASDAAASPPFAWGVASGDPTTESVRLWTRIDLRDDATGGLPPARWQIWETLESAGHVVLDGEVNVAVDGIVQVHAGGLASGRRYSYRFGFEGRWSVVGTTSTLGSDNETMKLGIACCARLASGPLTAYEGLRLVEPDLVVHLGDYIYEDGGRDDDVGEKPEPPRECRTFDDYSARYAQYRRDENLQRLHQSVPWVAMPDDHEITGNAFPPEHQDADGDHPVDPPSPERRAAALAAHQRWMPQATHGNGPTLFDRHIPIGQVADLVLVDTRLGGRQEPAGSGPTIVTGAEHQQSDQRSLLSEVQWAWLDDVVAAADRPWLVLASQVQVAPLRLFWLPLWSWPPRLRPIVNPDQWDGYPADRDRLIELLDRHDVQQVLIISGDLHARFVSTIDRGDGRRIVEVTTPSVSAPTFASMIQGRIPLPTRWGAWRLVARWIRRINPHIVDMDLDHHGTTLLHINPTSIIVTGVSPAGQPTQRWAVTAEGVTVSRNASPRTGRWAIGTRREERNTQSPRIRAGFRPLNLRSEEIEV
jgi:alkaline phosphatase D